MSDAKKQAGEEMADMKRRKADEERRSYVTAAQDQKRKAFMSMIDALALVPAALEPSDEYDKREQQQMVLRAVAEFYGLRKVTQEIDATDIDDVDQ